MTTDARGIAAALRTHTHPLTKIEIREWANAIIASEPPHIRLRVRWVLEDVWYVPSDENTSVSVTIQTPEILE